MKLENKAMGQAKDRPLLTHSGVGCRANGVGGGEAASGRPSTAVGAGAPQPHPLLTRVLPGPSPHFLISLRS